MNTRHKKSLGQNFLRDPKILSKILDAAKITPEDTVLEIGPGEGTLTALLLKRAGRVLAVEKDEELVEKLKERFKKEIENGKLEIIEGDILEKNVIIEPFEVRRHENEENSSKNFPVRENDIFLQNGYILAGNIPYYITGEIFRKFLSGENQPKSLTFVIQREVAERIIARPVRHRHASGVAGGDGKESVLSISVKAYGEPEYGGLIKAGSFSPRPKVDSAILSVRNINKEKFQNISEKPFFEVLKKGFAHKRKILAGNLGIKPEILEKLGIPAKTRAENLSIDDWFRLAREISPSKL